MKKYLRIGFYQYIDQTKTRPEVVIREFGDDEYINMKEKTKILWETSSFYTSWSLCHNNYMKYIEFSGNKKEIEIHPFLHMGSVNMYQDMEEMSRLVINLLATASTFLIVTQRLMKTLFGTKSDEYKKWNDFRQSLHKRSIHYQVCYELRNFSQHYEIPFSGIDNKFEGKFSSGFDPFIDVEAIIVCGYDWKKFKSTLQSIESRINLSEFINGYYSCLNDIFFNTYVFFEDKIEDCGKCIEKIKKEFGLPSDCEPILFTNNDFELDFNRQDQEHIPNGYYNHITDIMKNSKSKI